MPNDSESHLPLEFAWDALDLAFDFSFQNISRCRRAWDRVACRAVASPFRGRKIWKRDLSHPFYSLKLRSPKTRWRNQGALSDDERSSKRRCRESTWTGRTESTTPIGEEVATMSPVPKALPAPMEMPAMGSPAASTTALKRPLVVRLSSPSESSRKRKRDEADFGSGHRKTAQGRLDCAASSPARMDEEEPKQEEELIRDSSANVSSSPSHEEMEHEELQRGETKMPEMEREDKSSIPPRSEEATDERADNDNPRVSTSKFDSTSHPDSSSSSEAIHPSPPHVGSIGEGAPLLSSSEPDSTTDPPGSSSSSEVPHQSPPRVDAKQDQPATGKPEAPDAAPLPPIPTRRSQRQAASKSRAKAPSGAIVVNARRRLVPPDPAVKELADLTRANTKQNKADGARYTKQRVNPPDDENPVVVEVEEQSAREGRRSYQGVPKTVVWNDPLVSFAPDEPPWQPPDPTDPSVSGRQLRSRR
ncbi:MAG: hypothetical protein M1823_004042 [Watsoniomyces obsoletus]|nr:MAG: hypothetical protein M1823_004042 [Watsoniomyces obsoletus]